jgi:MFS family permease
MILSADRKTPVVVALGVAQTIGWASTYYLVAVLATPIAQDLGISSVWVFTGFTAAMIVSAMVGPWAGRVIDQGYGRGILIGSNLIAAAGLVLLGISQTTAVMLTAWLVIGLAMGSGLYEAAFATLTRIYGHAARSPITGITLIAGFASTVGWPTTGIMEATIGWRGACFGWAVIHLALALPLNLILPKPSEAPPIKPSAAAADAEVLAPVSNVAMGLLAFVFAATWFCSTAMAAHLPRVLEAAGATTAVAIAAGALIGPAQVAARIAEYGLLQRLHPLVSARIATLTHPIGAVVLLAVGGPGAYAFALLHGAGNGILTIAKGTLPLALFGPVGYGLRQGILSAPARAVQAFAPLGFGAALEVFGLGAIWLTAGLSLASLVALFALRTQRPVATS